MISHPQTFRRLAAVLELLRRPRTRPEIANILEMNERNAWTFLRAMQDQGWVESTRRGHGRTRYRATVRLRKR